jgi:hypothetical protein
MRPRLPSLKPASPESLALAGLGAFLLEAVVGAMLLFWFVDRYAPPQDLAWKPFSLDHPLGLATGRKLARISADPEACAAALSEGRVRFTPLPEKHDGFCSTVDGVRLEGGVTRLSPAGPVMTCKQALAIALFDRQVLQPAARAFPSTPTPTPSIWPA